MFCRQNLVSSLLIVAAIAGCGSKSKLPKMDPVFPVSGTVKLDGEPATTVVPFACTVAGISDMIATPATTTAQSTFVGKGTIDAEGKLKFTTYKYGDGLPAGEYVICFYWPGKIPTLSISGDDEIKLDATAAKFGKKYGVSKNSKFRVTVGENQKGDLGEIELTTK